MQAGLDPELRHVDLAAEFAARPRDEPVAEVVLPGRR